MASESLIRHSSRVKKYALIFMTWASLIASILATMGWARGRYVRDEVESRWIIREKKQLRTLFIEIWYGEITIAFWHDSLESNSLELPQWEWKTTIPSDMLPERADPPPRLEWHFTFHEIRNGYQLQLQYWSIVLATAVLPIAVGFHSQLVQRQRRRRRMCSLCEQCGYSLLGCDGNCPECGAARPLVKAPLHGTTQRAKGI